MNLPCLTIFFAATISGCATTIDPKTMPLIDISIPMEVNAVSLTVNDKREDQKLLEVDIPTSWGKGRRVSDTSFKQPPLATFAVVLGNKLGQQKYTGTQSTVEISQFDIALTKTQAKRVDVNGTPGTQAYIAQNGATGAGAGLVAQGLIQLFENSRSPTILSLKAQMEFSGQAVECNGSATIEGDNIALAWAEVVHSSTGQCAYELTKQDKLPSVRQKIN